MMPARATFCFNCSMLFALPSYEGGMTGPPRKPSSVTSVQRTPGIHSDFTQARSTPGVTESSSLICFSASRYSGSKMSPCVFSTTTRSALPRPRRSFL